MKRMTKHELSLEQADYLAEMMNIGAGNAATALEAILHANFEMRMPSIHIGPPHKVFSVIGNPSEPVICVKMNMIGDIRGEIFFIAPQAVETYLVELAEYSAYSGRKKGDITDISIIEEIGNILAGAYLTAIHDFCKLNIYHTIPFTARDMAQAVLDETIARMRVDAEFLIIIVNKFESTLRNKNEITTMLVLFPDKDSEKVLLDSVVEANKICGR